MEPTRPIARKLDPKEVYLKEAVESALAHHLFTALFLIKELLKEIIKCLPPDRRADILMQCAGLSLRKTALKMDPSSSVNMLELAMAEEDTSPDKILHVLTTDDLIRYVDPKKICGLIIRTEWFKKPEHRPFMAVLINGVILHKLLEDPKQKPPLDTPDAIVELIGYDQFMGDRMPPDLRTEYFKQCVLLARGAIPGGTRTPRHFPANDMLKQMFRPEVLVQHLEPSVLYRVFEAVALKYGWIEKSEPAAPAASSDPAALPPLPGAGDAGAAASASGANGKGLPPVDDGSESGTISVVGGEEEEDAAATLRGVDVPPPLDGSAAAPVDVDLGLDLDFLGGNALPTAGGAEATAEAADDRHNAPPPAAVQAVPKPTGKPVPPPPPRPQGK